MSVIETAGLVLSTLPLLIFALENYTEGTSRVKKWWRYGMGLKALWRALDVEFELYRSTCELLLSKIIADPSEIKRLLEEPGGVEWRGPDLGRALEKFLGHSYPSYLKTMDGMNSTVACLKQRLCLDANGEASFLVSTS